MIQKENIKIIYAKHAWSACYIEELGYSVCDPYIFNSLPQRLIRELWFRLKLPGRSYFYNKKCIDENKILIVYESLISVDYLRWLHNKCQSCRIILLYTNKVGSYVRPDQIEDSWCEKWTCDKDDFKKYGMKMILGGGYFPQWKVKSTEKKYDVFYIGKDKNRLGRLLQIEAEFKKNGINPFFYITWEKSWQKKKDGIHRPFLSYDDVLKYIGESKAILHLLDGAQNGITLRIQESLIHKVKLITDDINIQKYDFYNPNNIFIIGKDKMEHLKGFIETPFVDVESEFYKHAYYDDMIQEIIDGVEVPFVEKGSRV